MTIQYLGPVIRDHYDFRTKEWTQVVTQPKLVEDSKGGMWVVFIPIPAPHST